MEIDIKNPTYLSILLMCLNKPSTPSEISQATNYTYNYTVFLLGVLVKKGYLVKTKLTHSNNTVSKHTFYEVTAKSKKIIASNKITKFILYHNFKSVNPNVG